MFSHAPPSQTSHGILRHPEPRPGVSITAVTARKSVPAAHKSPSMRKGWRGQRKPGTRREVKSPRGKGRGLLSDATHLLGTMQGVNTGSPGVTLHRGCPLPEPTGAPGGDVTLGRQRGEGLGPAGASGAAPPHPRTVAVLYF